MSLEGWIRFYPWRLQPFRVGGTAEAKVWSGGGGGTGAQGQAVTVLGGKAVVWRTTGDGQGREVGLTLDLQVMISIRHCSRHCHCLISISGEFRIRRKHVCGTRPHISFKVCST